MNKKGSMELSVNSIVILVIAIVMLGLILGFVKSKFTVLDNQIGSNEPNAPTASASNPFTISRDQIAASPGEELGIKFSAYADTKIESTNLITFTCGSGATDFVKSGGSTGKNIAVDTVGTYIVVLKVPTTVTKGKQVCVASLKDKTIDVMFEVK
jgi:hypothetical protein